MEDMIGVGINYLGPVQAITDLPETDPNGSCRIVWANCNRYIRLDGKWEVLNLTHLIQTNGTSDYANIVIDKCLKMVNGCLVFNQWLDTEIAIAFKGSDKDPEKAAKWQLLMDVKLQFNSILVMTIGVN